MYKTLLFSLAIFITINLSAQQNDSIVQAQELFDSLLVEGIMEFDKPLMQSDYKNAVNALEQTIALQPNNPRAHYYLGYAYSRLNSKDGSHMALINKQLTIKSSEQMEEVIRLDSTYKPNLILSPYSKITSEWGSLALYYINANQLDSAKWAFTEGGKRGGFSQLMLEYRRIQLDQCSPNAILFSFGDDCFYNIMYLQYVEDFRNDVAVVDLGLINTLWYQQMLKARDILEFTPAKPVEPKYFLVSWSDTIIEIPIQETGEKFTWNFESHGTNPYYLYLGDVAFQSIFVENKFKRDLYFVTQTPTSSQFNLHFYFENHILNNKLNPAGKKILDNNSYNIWANRILGIMPQHNSNYLEEKELINFIRLSLLSRIYQQATTEGENENAKYLLELLLEKLPEQEYPYINKETQLMVERIKPIILEG